jgi:ADP-ribose pyrophosphatase YjhB (NUDIX family)
MDQIPNWFYRVSAKALILNGDKKFLLIREEKWWELPWWWLEYWEAPQEWIKRELFEEMWINVISVKENPSYFITAKKDNWVWIANVIYETQVNINEISNFKPSDECLEVRFFDINEAQNENLFPNVREFIKQFNPSNQ